MVRFFKKWIPVVIAALVLILPVSAADVTALGDLTEGSIVYINENGSPVEFYVAKHDYESGLNGMGRTLLVRKNQLTAKLTWIYTTGDSLLVTYDSSHLHKWLSYGSPTAQSSYIKTLDEDIKLALGTTNIYCNNASNNVTTISCPVFVLSISELGLNDGSYPTEGSLLPIASTLLQAYTGSGSTWVRTATTSGTASNKKTYTYNVGGSSTIVYHGTPSSSTFAYAFPAFTLPATLAVTSSGTVLTYAVPASLTAEGPREYRVGEAFIPGDVPVAVTYHDGSEKLVVGSNCAVVLNKVS